MTSSGTHGAGAARVLVVADQHQDVAATLRDWGFELVGAAPLAFDAVELSRELVPELALLTIEPGATDDRVHLAFDLALQLGCPSLVVSDGAAGSGAARVSQTSPLVHHERPIGERALRTTLELMVAWTRADRRARQHADAREQLQIENERLGARLVHAQRLELVGRLAATVAHDFNNLLSAVEANLHLLRHDALPEQLELIADVGVAVDRGATLAQRLLRFGRPDEAVLERCELRELVGDAQPLLRLLPNSIRVLVSHGPEPAPVRADRDLIAFVLMNLAVNARDAMPSGGRLSITTSVRDRDGTRYGVLEVSDTGPGVPAELRERIFEPFFTTKPRGEGTGLGLCSVRDLVRQVGGEVTVTDAVGGGASFVVALPLEREQATSERSP